MTTFSTKFVDRLLNSAVTFYEYKDTSPESLPDTYDNVNQGVDTFAKALFYEAHVSMKQEIDRAKKPILHAVNLDSDKPGIIVGLDKTQALVHHDAGEYIPDPPKPVKKLSRAQLEKQAEKAQEKIASKTLKNLEKAAIQKEKKEAKAIERKQKAAERKAEKAKAKKQDDSDDESMTNPEVEPVPPQDDSLSDNHESNEQTPPPKEKKVKPAPDTLEHLVDHLSTTPELGHAQLATRVQEFPIDELALHASPVPFERHIIALEECSPNPCLVPTLLWGKPPPFSTFSVAAPTGIFMFHGPPGTGKTHRLMMELGKMLELFPYERFFVCAASNIGTANLYTRAKSLGISGCLVMNDDNIPPGTVQDEKEKKRWNLTRDRVVFATVSMRNGSQLKAKKFQTIIMDEAAQCQEPWTWGLLRKEVHRVLMAGDPMQLPATVSQQGEKLGHGTSLMARLMKLGVPAELLNVQRRMHPDIVKFPNDMFYDNKLKTDFKIDPNQTLEPLKIVHVDGQEKRVGTSWTNPQEVKRVLELVEECKKSYDQVIVISPYQAQCDLLRPKCEVHTVDSFQGREADCVIVCTVRSGNSVGFWEDERRLNVALTRARHVLRIVGNTETWKKSKGALAELGL